jgi:uncharacterized repeat protein (TIGR03803 family)
VLYSFTGGSDGCYPGGVILDAGGNLYGVAANGGSESCSFGGDGVVFELDTAGSFSVLHTFGGLDGASPGSVLLLDSGGNLYGTTAYGGSSTTCRFGCGTVFKVAADRTETVLYSFCSLQNCTDGERPLSGPLVRDRAGNLYGTTLLGGSYPNCNRDTCGVVFKLDSTGKETVLHSFSDGADGALPYAGLVMALQAISMARLCRAAIPTVNLTEYRGAAWYSGLAPRRHAMRGFFHCSRLFVCVGAFARP